MPQLLHRRRLWIRLNRRCSSIAVIVAMVLATLTLALFIDELLDGEWPLGDLLSLIR